MLAVILLFCATGLHAQRETFSVVTLNVDGLPQKILWFDVNATGPGATYTTQISNYLAAKDYDFVATQENFNFHSQLSSALDDNYQHDEWSGGIGNGTSNFDALEVKYSCDGLTSFWKNQITLTTTERTAWQQAYGKFDHCWDDIVTKGFRRYELQLPGGTPVVVYNLHMDATEDDEGLTGQDDSGDWNARHSQWIQLRDDIIARLDQRPVIVLGDMNSFYSRDQIEETFIQAIEETGMASVSDVWVELMFGGEYPAPQASNIAEDGTIIGWKHDNETLDNILYVNPVRGYQLRPLAVSLDSKNFTREDGVTRLSDHDPLAATFEVLSQTPVGITDMTQAWDGGISSNSKKPTAGVFAPDGRQLQSPRHGLNLVRTADGRTVKVIIR